MHPQTTQRYRHDVRGALNVIRLNTELLNLQPSREELPYIIKALERAVLKIEGLLDATSTELRVPSFCGEGITADDREQPTLKAG